MAAAVAGNGRTGRLLSLELLAQHFERQPFLLGRGLVGFRLGELAAQLGELLRVPAEQRGIGEALLQQAVAAIPDLVAVSPVYETDPVGGPEQGAFLNCVVELDTERTPHELLALCQQLEQEAERVRIERWGPRTLDVDVLLVGDLTVDDPDLEVPHPRMFQRRFVLAPLADLAPELVPADVLAAAEGDVRRTSIDLRGG